MRERLKLVIFIPGYTLLGSVYKNYRDSLSDIPSILFDYYDCESLESAQKGLEQIIIDNKEKKIAIIAQSTGFKIIGHSVVDHENVQLVLALNPFYQPPKKLPFGKQTHQLIIKLLANVSRTYWGKFLLIRNLSINQLMFSRKVLGNPYYRSYRLRHCLVQLKNQREQFYRVVYNPMRYLYIGTNTSKNESQKYQFLIGMSDRLLRTDFKKRGYYDELTSIYPKAKILSMKGGHEGFLEYEVDWIDKVADIVKMTLKEDQL